VRVPKRSNGLVALAVAGSHVVLLGWDVVDDKRKKNLLGFAIQRADHTEDETYWLRGMKTFPDTTPPLGPGQDASSHEQPYQTFQWGDYTAKAEHDYSYTIVPMYGKPGALTDGDSITVRVTTESQWGSPHSVFFNRGAVASQEYARRFQNKKPSVFGEAAYAWLSRGLLEAMVVFIQRAKGDTFALRGAIYEFQWHTVLDELKAAKDRKVDVQIIYDAIDNPKHDPVEKNQAAIATAKIKGLCHGFEHGKLMHNKFIVLLKNDEPIAVWTGSTNITENGIFGHLNCGHAVEDKDVAQQYLDYWTQLRADPGSPVIKTWTDEHSPTPPNPPDTGTSLVYSPQTGLASLKRYGELADRAKRGLFMTFAFGMNKVFQPVYEQNDEVLRFALMEKEGNGAGLEKGKEDIGRIRKLPNVLVAVGHNIALNSFDRWLKEISSAVSHANVYWVHTKFMLIDPLSDDPIVITGSANFSDASTSTNEENLLLIRGDTRVADIYLGEFMRSFSHYAFREAVYIYAQAGKDAEDWKPQYLIPDSTWLDRYMKQGSAGDLKRRYFSGQ
jgi:phosphatidylserine/phosphatidylglycerophosphate/cardiolipin synthase-like enzyme